MLAPDDLRPILHRATRAARRRKALDPDDLPFGVVALDGKSTVVPACDDFYAQRQTAGDDAPLASAVRTVTATLVSAAARPVIDVTSIPASTHEMGCFARALDALMATYERSDLFRLVTYDAGACSADNAGVVRKHGLHYLFGLNASQPTLYNEAALWLGSRPSREADAMTSDVLGGATVVRRLYIGEATAAPGGKASAPTRSLTTSRPGRPRDPAAAPDGRGRGASAAVTAAVAGPDADPATVTSARRTVFAPASTDRG